MRGLRPTLVTVNAALLAALAYVTVAGPRHAGALAQPAATGAGAAARGRGDYLLLSGRVRGGISNVTYVVDTANQELLALSWDRSRRQLVPLGWRNLADDGAVAPAAPAAAPRSGGVNR